MCMRGPSAPPPPPPPAPPPPVLEQPAPNQAGSDNPTKRKREGLSRYRIDTRGGNSASGGSSSAIGGLPRIGGS